MTNAPIHVVAGVLRDAQGRVLLAQRPVGKELAGYWEFPGGKVEPCESPEAGLARELLEELGIRATIGRRRIAIPHGRIVLDVRDVTGYEGTLRAREGQSLAWIAPHLIDPNQLPPADRPALTSLCLPDQYLITPVPGHDDDAAFMKALELAMLAGVRLIQLRLPGWPRQRVAHLARRVRDACRAENVRLVLNADWQLAMLLGLDGVHLPAHIACSLSERVVPHDRLLGVSCHNAAELEHAAAIGADFATLSPVSQTASHVEAHPLGWPAVAGMVADAAMPVYALGGLSASDRQTAFDMGFQGIAAIRSLWHRSMIAP